MAQNNSGEQELQQPMPSTEAAVVFARALAKVDMISPKAIVDPIRDLLETGLRSTVGAKRELPQGTLRALAIAVELVAADPDPEAGTGAFAH